MRRSLTDLIAVQLRLETTKIELMLLRKEVARLRQRLLEAQRWDGRGRLNRHLEHRPSDVA
jgi:hypothetical protein